jgi:FMN-dependent NADH-azoreductase
MKTLLHVKSSLFGDQGQSAQLAGSFISRWTQENPDSSVIERDLAADPVPHLDAFRMGALNTPEADRSQEQQAVVELADQLLAEVKAADVIVIGLPMYNFSVPSQLKSWFDHLARAGVTFQYTETGVQGLIEDRPVYLISTRGGVYGDEGSNMQISYVKQLLSFMGLNNQQLVVAEGLAMDDHRDAALEKARAALA